MMQKCAVYIAIDLKSFYASVECVERGLDPMTTNLVVADVSRTEKTICLAVSPSLKAYGISGRARLFEVIQRVKEVNVKRQEGASGHRLEGASWDEMELKASPEKALDYIVAPPRMAHYIEYSKKIYEIYLKYVAPEDCHVYSIDEIMIDVTQYLRLYGLSARELAGRIIEDIRLTTGITATAGIGTNLYLSKVAMDIVAKHIPPDKNGARIAELTEMSYRRILWTHRPITDFWRVGSGYAKRLAEHGLFTMGDVARCSIGKPDEYHNEELLYKLFGVNAELLIDHAWGWEPCTMADIKAYKPETNSMSSGQVLAFPYTTEKAKLVVREMAEQLALELVDRGLVTDQITLTIGYDNRNAVKHSHGTTNLKRQTSSTACIVDATLELYDRIIREGYLVRRVMIGANHVIKEASAVEAPVFEQLCLFTDYNALGSQREKERIRLQREKKLQKAVLSIKKDYGKNAILKGTSLLEGATAKERNQQIGGHKA